MTQGLRRLWMVAASALVASCSTNPEVLSGYGSVNGPFGSTRPGGQHPAVDFAGKWGMPVIAAAPGRVVATTRREVDCGWGVRLAHEDFDRYTLYCYLMEPPLVRVGDRVERGQLLGKMGISGLPERLWAQRGLSPLPLLHFELSRIARDRSDGDLDDTFDPMEHIEGCHDGSRTYPTDRLVLTFPLPCPSKT